MHVWWKDILLFCGGMLAVLAVIGGLFLLVRTQVFSQNNVTVGPTDHRTFHSDERKEIVIGTASSDVADVHEHLVLWGVAPTEAFVDEVYFGEKTQYYVMLFQLTHDIVPTGIVDQETWRMLLRDPQGGEVGYQRVPIDPGYDNADLYFSQYVTKTAYLTFDVRGNVQQMEHILTLLEKHSAYATFFFSQDLVKNDPEIVKSTFDAGHGIGILLEDRWDFEHTTYSEISTDMLNDAKGINTITGRTPWCARPTYSMLMSVAQIRLAQQPLRMMYWDVDPQDRSVPADTIVQHVLSYTQPGEVVLFHVNGTLTDDDNLLIALERIITQLRSQSWELRALSCI